MAGFIGRWLADSVRLGLALALALLFMQVPAVTAAYAAALQQIAEDARRDIERRKEIARQYYRLGESTDEAVIAALRPVEPSNAEGLVGSVEREAVLRNTQARLLDTPPLLRPIEAVLDILADGRGDKRAVLRTAVETHAPQVVLSSAAAIYGLVGLVTGSLLAQALVSPFGRRRARRDRQLPVR
ncbi:DUF2937 family protein [Roseomonas sp. BN140053]|uniref:DUF2937 family protein n=1 Tax=Roseomonas sp. BN140053 TaxID=3391898 RepID=UPI0039EC739C